VPYRRKKLTFAISFSDEFLYSLVYYCELTVYNKRICYVTLSAVPEMVDAHQNFNGSPDLIMPFSGMVCHPWASTCYF